MNYIPLEVAARRLGFTEAELRAMCEGDCLDVHGAEFGGQYVVSSASVERLSLHSSTPHD